MKDKIFKILKENTMLIVLVLVVIFFNITTKGTMLMPSQFNALITQNAYVYVLATIACAFKASSSKLAGISADTTPYKYSSIGISWISLFFLCNSFILLYSL